jgi:preprotein translocase subunit SecD
VDLQVPLDLAPVVPAGAAAPSPSVLPDPDGLPLTLSLPLVKVERLEDARVEFQENAGSWAVVLTLTAVDAQVFGDWTASHVGERLAVVADGKVIFAPQISAAITTGEVFISARYTQAEAGDLLNQLTGR